MGRQQLLDAIEQYRAGLETGVALLRQLKEVAMRAGFGDSSYFARVFKAATGKSPRAFQQTGRLS